MKKWLLGLLSACLLLVSCLFPPAEAKAFTPLDEIELFEITVSPNEDATLEMNYRIRWKVLDSDSEGPLTWVKIGVANRFQKNLTSRSDCISELSYSSDGGAFVEIYFDRDYRAGEIVDFSFSFTQERIFTYNEERDQIEFRFIPGWFEEIEVKTLRVLWKESGVRDANTQTRENGYYIWEYALSFNEQIQADVTYPKNYFPKADRKLQYSDSTEDPLPMLIAIGCLVALFLFFVILFLYTERNRCGGYYAHRGYYGRSFYSPWWFFVHHGVDRHGKPINPPTTVNSHVGGTGGHCACACACACAGGGRAGCSRKDFTVSAEQVNRALRHKNKENHS